MKHQRIPIIIEDSSDDEGPLRKRQKRTTALTLESLIRAGEALKHSDEDATFASNERANEDDNARALGRVTPTKEVLNGAKSVALDRKLVQTALNDTLVTIGAATKPMQIPLNLPEIASSSSSSSNDWRKFCRPLAAPPRLPNVPFGFKCV